MGPFNFQGPNKEKEITNGYLLTVIDCYTWWTEIILLPNISAMSVSEALDVNWFCRYPLPSKLTNDRGSQFISATFGTMLLKRRIENRPTLAYNFTGNAMCERIHKELNAGLHIYRQEKIEISLGRILEGMRSCFHRILTTIPNSIGFLRNKWNSHINYNQAQLKEEAEKSKERQRKADQKRTNGSRKKLSFLGKKVLIKRLFGEKEDDPCYGPFPVIEEVPEQNRFLVETESSRE